MAEIWNKIFVQFIATREAVAPLSYILSGQADQYCRLDTLNIKIRPNMMLWASAVGLEKTLQTEDRQRTDRETNYRGPSNCRWNSGLRASIDI